MSKTLKMKPINAEFVAGLIDREIMKAVGLKATSKFQIGDMTKFRQVLFADLAPNMCGPASRIFSRLTVRVRAGVTEKFDKLHIVFDFSYDHPSGGSNGYTTNPIILDLASEAFIVTESAAMREDEEG